MLKPDAGEADSRRRTLAEHVPTKTEQLGGPASCALFKTGCAINQPACFHKSTKVLLVKTDACERFDHSLQLE